MRRHARGRRTGSALVATLEELGRGAGRSVIDIETQWGVGADDAHGLGFAARHGYRAAQTTLRSEMALPADADVLADLAAGRDRPRPDPAAYVLETAADGVPEEWLTDRVALQRRMSTDVPLGELALGEEAWDERRLRDHVARTLATGRRWVETVAREAATGRLIGFTTLTVSAGDPTLAYQWDTLVLPEHRGHGLGLRLKAANALALQGAVTTVRRARTWNADDNAHMLAVNAALGYVTTGYLREWQKRLDA